ncbi:MAG: polysaccharide pyruvyl transferase family protein [Cetobacterium sp.]|uniref:polysaccharide pyruvyl transferase family protein n=1 Tax=Cetobacterium sp. TaxID=2071632 RepID=UPI003EE43AC1
MKVFLDIYLALNFGDDLFLDIILKRYPDVQFIVNYTGDLYTSFFKNYSNVKKRNYNLLHKILRRSKIYNHLKNYDLIAKECDCVVFIGGSIFRDENYHETLYKERNMILNSFLKYGKGTYIIGSNFGPCITDRFYNDYFNFFKKCEDVCFRDSYSKKLFLSLNNVRKASDVVFSISNQVKGLKNQFSKKIGYSVIDFNHKQGFEKYSEDYIQNTAKNINEFLKKGYKCELLSFCEEEGDMKVIKQILKLIDSKHIHGVSTYNYKGNLEIIINKISSYEIFIAARFHANILGLLLGIKLVPIIYNQKTFNLLEDIDYKGIFIDTNNLNKLLNIELFEELTQHKLSEKLIFDSENQFLGLDKLLRRI